MWSELLIRHCRDRSIYCGHRITFSFSDLGCDDDLKSFFAESLIMKDFDHPNVLRLLRVCLDAPDGHPYIVLPFMMYGNLRDYLRSRRVHLTDVNTYPKVKATTPSETISSTEYYYSVTVRFMLSIAL